MSLQRLNEHRLRQAEILLEKGRLLKEMNVGRFITKTIDLEKLVKHKPEAQRGEKYYHDRLCELGLKNELYESRGAVYYFHLPNCNTDHIVEAIRKYKKNTNCRNTTSINNIEGRKAKCLYVGSIKARFRDRFIQHLGYGTPNTAALQLVHWASPLFPQIKLSYLPIEFSEYALHTQMEIALSQTYTPLIGKMEKNILNAI